MCGIAGIVSNNQKQISKEKIKSALKCLRHRGTDGEGVWMNDENTIALAHLRLSIIDLSKEAAQPMHYLNRYCIVHNGEVYNYLEIKDALQKKGYRFVTKSDTEVIVAAYDCYKENCLQQFDGMFAFAIWDEQEKNYLRQETVSAKNHFSFFMMKNNCCSLLK